MEIKVLKIKLINSGKPLRAFVDVQVGELIINNWKIVQKEDEKIKVNIPQVSWKGQDGKIYYRALLTIPEGLKQQIETEILSSWKKEQEDEIKR